MGQRAGETHSSVGKEVDVFPLFGFSVLRSCFFFDLLLLSRPSRWAPWSGGLGLDACREDLELLSGNEGIHPTVEGGREVNSRRGDRV